MNDLLEQIDGTLDVIAQRNGLRKEAVFGGPKPKPNLVKPQPIKMPGTGSNPFQGKAMGGSWGGGNTGANLSMPSPAPYKAPTSGQAGGAYSVAGRPSTAASPSVGSMIGPWA